MHTETFFKLIVAFVLLGLLAGCESVPTEELEQARTTLAMADSAQAHLYAPELYREAQDALAAAQRAIDAGNYDEARTLLEAARAGAARAANQAPAMKEAMRTEAEALMMEAEEAIGQLTQAAQRTRNRTRRAALQEGIRTIEAALEDARTALGGGDVQTAHERARAAHGEAGTLMSKLMEGKSASWTG